MTLNLNVVGAVCASLLAAGCSTMPTAGPTAKAIQRSGNQAIDGNQIKVIDLTADVARLTTASLTQSSFAREIGDGRALGLILKRGDVVDVNIWEAPPAMLFGTAGGDTRLGASSSSALVRGTTLPEQAIDGQGNITVPFVGSVIAAGRTPTQIAQTITSRLRGKANAPQAIVRLSRNAASNVTVVGDVANSTLVPLSSRGERILDALAAAGGVKQPVGKLLIQVSRGVRTVTMPLASVISDPQQNIRLETNDVLTVLFQPYSFTALGAIGKNEEIAFEGTGLTLAQAMGRTGGLQDSRANAKGVFIFRFEDPAALDPTMRGNVPLTQDGKIPVIYRVDMRDPTTLLVAQRFPIRDKDVLFVSNAPLADFQKFVSVIYSTFLPVASTATAF